MSKARSRPGKKYFFNSAEDESGCPIPQARWPSAALPSADRLARLIGAWRRFTLARELCHILYDRSYGAHLGIASGPWAPANVEKRANAFAAMFLMPTELVGEAIRALTVPLGSPQGVWQVAKRLQTSFTSTVDHLSNLGYLDESTRDSICAAVLARAAAAEN